MSAYYPMGVSDRDFTLGPWEVHENKVPGYERVISVCANGDLGVCRLDGGGSSNPKVLVTVRANARLIAAAPALYEALKAVVRVADRKTVEFDAARAALALVERNSK